MLQCAVDMIGVLVIEISITESISVCQLVVTKYQNLCLSSYWLVLKVS